MRKIVVLAALITLPLAACSDWDVPEDQTFPAASNAVRQNITAQIANPKAPAGTPPQTMNGERASLAIDRYAKGETIPPENMDENKNSKQGNSNGGSSPH